MSESRCARQPKEASQVKKGDYIILDLRPCKIVSVSVSKTGKHGHMKVTMTGIDVLNAKKHISNVPGHTTVTQFEIDKKDYQLVDIEENTFQYLDENSEMGSITIEEETEITKKIKEEFATGKMLTISVVRAPVQKAEDNFIDEEVIEAYKEDKN